MITLKEIKEQQDKLNEMIEKYEKHKKKVVYELEFPDHATEAFLIDSEGHVTDVCYTEAYESDFGQGNIRFTEEEAELEVKRRDLITRFNQFRNKCNGDWKPDFSNIDKKIYITKRNGKMIPAWWTEYQDYNQFGYFKSEADCHKAIELFGDEIKELY